MFREINTKTLDDIDLKWKDAEKNAGDNEVNILCTIL
jgi:hypothetical protein